MYSDTLLDLDGTAVTLSGTTRMYSHTLVDLMYSDTLLDLDGTAVTLSGTTRM